MMRNKTVLITGSGGGIGRSTALRFAREGARLMLSDRVPEALEDTAEQARALGAEVATRVCDISDAQQVEELIDAAVARFGSLNAAFNNAGVGGAGQPFADASDEQFERCIGVNLVGTWYCMKHEVRAMLKSGGGAIVNNCSILGVNGGANAAYCASKHGIAGLTKSAAVTYGSQRIRVNAVCPGLIEAGLGLNVLNRDPGTVQQMIAMHPLGRPGTADEVAEAVFWLSSDASSYLTGHLLAVDGGYLAR